MDSKMKMIADSEQKMQKILETKGDRLDAFLFDHSAQVEQYRAAKALIAVAQAHHIACKMED